MTLSIAWLGLALSPWVAGEPTTAACNVPSYAATTPAGVDWPSAARGDAVAERTATGSQRGTVAGPSGVHLDENEPDDEPDPDPDDGPEPDRA